MQTFVSPLGKHRSIRKDDIHKTRATTQGPRTLLTRRSVIQILQLEPYLDPEIINPKKKYHYFILFTLSLKENKSDLLFSYPSQCKSLKNGIAHFWRTNVPNALNTVLTAAVQQGGDFYPPLRDQKIKAQRICPLISNGAWNSALSWTNSGGPHSFRCTAAQGWIMHGSHLTRKDNDNRDHTSRRALCSYPSNSVCARVHTHTHAQSPRTFLGSLFF